MHSAGPKSLQKWGFHPCVLTSRTHGRSVSWKGSTRTRTSTKAHKTWAAIGAFPPHSKNQAKYNLIFVVMVMYKPKRQIPGCHWSSPSAPAEWGSGPSELGCWRGLSLLWRAVRWISCEHWTNNRDLLLVAHWGEISVVVSWSHLQ